MTWTRPARLLLLSPLVGAALVGPVALPALADESGHDHSTVEPSTVDHSTMDHSTSSTTDTHEHEAEPTTDHQHGSAPKDRPLALVLGTFGGVNGAVVLGAALVRRRERAARQEKQSRRSQGRAIPAEVAE